MIGLCGLVSSCFQLFFQSRILYDQLYISRVDRYPSAWASHSGLEGHHFLRILLQRISPVFSLLQKIQKEQKTMHLRYKQHSSSLKSYTMPMPYYTRPPTEL